MVTVLAGAVEAILREEVLAVDPIEAPEARQEVLEAVVTEVLAVVEVLDLYEVPVEGHQGLPDRLQEEVAEEETNQIYFLT